MPRTINSAGLHLVEHFEGLYLHAYLCPAGVPTIGYGHTAGVRLGQTITEAQADAFLAADLSNAGNAVARLVHTPLNDNQFAALVSFVFNLGAGALGSSTLLQLLNQGQYAAVPAQLGRWVYCQDPSSGQMVKLTGLVNRRTAEAALWDTDPAALPCQAPQTQDGTP